MLSETINYIIKNVPFYRFTFANAVKPMQKFLDTILFEILLTDTLIIHSLKVKINFYHWEKGQKRLLFMSSLKFPVKDYNLY